MKTTLLLLLLSGSLLAQKFQPSEIRQWQLQASQITIHRDNWGIAHIYGKTDADVVFGSMYSQCEDDFERVERNYIVATARLAEAEGEAFIYNDLRTRLFIDTLKAIKIYSEGPEWMKKICASFAAGINYYIYTHPEVKPKLLKRFQPWMPLLFSEGSIGGDIEGISLNSLKEFYGKLPGDLKEEVTDDGLEPEPRGSNGFAIAPSISASGNSLLLINPHTSFYFRSELHMVSEEGLNAYGAATWGQFFIYQGFNSHCGWMHTSSEADAIDEYKETIVSKSKRLFYKYGKELKPLTETKISIAYQSDKAIQRKEFTVYHTQHGPVIAQRDGKWITVKLMQEPLKALTQSYTRTKAVTFDDFKKSMDLHTNSSNNTVYADDQGNIAYWHGNFIPKRDTRFDWNVPLDGSDPSTEWNGLHSVDEMIHVYNPATGWIQNCNSTPFTVSGISSPEKGKFPTYMAPDAENARGIHAVRVLANQNGFTLDKLIATAYDSYLPGFEKLLPSLSSSFDQLASVNDTLKAKYSEPIQLIRAWDMRYAASSIPTTLSIYWAQRLRQNILTRIPANSDQLSIIEFLRTQTTPTEKVNALAQTIAELQRDFGTWKQPWGEVNRFQRLSGQMNAGFDDQQSSIAVPFTSSFWGSLAAYGSRRYPNTKKMYGSVGNSFVAVVEFGKKLKAKAIMTGGQNSNPNSPHFKDQASMYCEGQFRDVLFYKEDIMNHLERTYSPGNR